MAPTSSWWILVLNGLWPLWHLALFPKPMVESSSNNAVIIAVVVRSIAVAAAAAALTFAVGPVGPVATSSTSLELCHDIRPSCASVASGIVSKTYGRTKFHKRSRSSGSNRSSAISSSSSSSSSGISSCRRTSGPVTTLPTSLELRHGILPRCACLFIFLVAGACRFQKGFSKSMFACVGPLVTAFDRIIPRIPPSLRSRVACHGHSLHASRRCSSRLAFRESM